MNSEPLQFTLTAVFESAPEGGFTCYFAELPEVFSEGETIAEAQANLHDALQLVLSHHREESRGASGSDAVRQTYALSAAA